MFIVFCVRVYLSVCVYICVMNIMCLQALMFWVVDNFLMKKSRTKAKVEEREGGGESRSSGKVRYRRALSHDESESEVSCVGCRYNNNNNDNRGVSLAASLPNDTVLEFLCESYTAFLLGRIIVSYRLRKILPDLENAQL